MAVSELPGNPNAVWTVKKNIDGNVYFIHRDKCGSLHNTSWCQCWEHLNKSFDKYLNVGEFEKKVLPKTQIKYLSSLPVEKLRTDTSYL